MPIQDKVLLMNKVEETLKPRMFANLLEEAVEEIQDHLDEFEISHIGNEVSGTEDLLDSYINAKKVGGRSEKTLFRYRYVIERFLKSCGVRTKDITTEHIRNYCGSSTEEFRAMISAVENHIVRIESNYVGTKYWWV